MAKEPEKLSDAIRRAIDDSPMSKYAICKKLNINQGHMSKFMHREAAFSQDRLDELGLLFGLRIVRDEETGKES